MRIQKVRVIILTVTVMILAAGMMLMTGCGKSYEYKFGELDWYSTYRDKADETEMKTIRDSFYYSDGWFSDSPESENKELALASMQLAASSVTDDEDGAGASFLKEMGFEEVGFSDFSSDDPDDCNYTWGRKKLDDGVLVAVAVQSASDDPAIKNKGWKQNFTVNDPESGEPSGEHYAYSLAVDKVIDDIAALGGQGKVKYWITGQSRGGAIANILSARLPEKLASGDADIFAYTFEAPATVDADAAGSDHKYIHNYVCNDDIVTLIPIWGMTRYGVMHDLRTKETDEGLADELQKLGSDAAGMKPRIVTEDVAARIAERFEERVPDRADYSKKRTDKWTDADGNQHEVTYSYQEAFRGMMDLVFREDSSVSLLDGLAGKKDRLAEAVIHLSKAIMQESSGDEPSAEYWEGSESLYEAMKEIDGEGTLPVSEEDVYKLVRFAAPILVSIPEGGSGDPDTELLADVIGYNKELTYSHNFDTIIARLKILAPEPENKQE